MEVAANVLRLDAQLLRCSFQSKSSFRLATSGKVVLGRAIRRRAHIHGACAQAHGARRRISLAHAVLRSALAEARRLQLVSINAAELVKVPRSTSRPIT